MTQQQLAQELGTRQQTVSEWELGLYTPKGTSVKLLSMISEQAGFPYDTETYRRDPVEGPGSG